MEKKTEENGQEVSADPVGFTGTKTNNEEKKIAETSSKEVVIQKTKH